MVPIGDMLATHVLQTIVVVKFLGKFYAISNESYMASTISIALKLLWLTKLSLSLMHVNLAEDLIILKVLKFCCFKKGILTAFFCLF